MPRETDLAYLRYAVARLAGFRNVWWSFANEYDLMRNKTMLDWDDYLDVYKRQPITMTLNADGTAVTESAETQTTQAVWSVEGGVAMMEGGEMSLTEDGSLCAQEDGVEIYFVREGEAVVTAVSYTHLDVYKRQQQSGLAATR